MDSLLQCRTLWNKVKSLTAPPPPTPESASSDSEPEEQSTKQQISTAIPLPLTKKQKKDLARSQAQTIRAQKIQSGEASLASLSSLLPSSKTSSLKKKPTKITFDDDSASDFGEETHLDAHTSREKALRKRNLGFYTSQIAQKANKRMGAGREAGGDADLPYRERLKDRQARLNAEAEKWGKKLDEYGRGAALGGDSDGEEDGDREVAKQVRDEGDDEYYNLVSKASKDKKAKKADAVAAEKLAAVEKGLIRVEDAELDEDGKRAIGYVITQNKGLMPTRKKDVRNPRVKKRKKYEEKKKKLGSMKAIYKGGEERGGYGGEKTGIKSGLVKSIKL